MKLLIGILTLCLLACTSCEQSPPELDEETKDSNKVAYERGIKILKDQGADAGIDYFRSLAVEIDKPYPLFYTGWSLWQSGEPREARKVANFILDNVSHKKTVAAGCYYMLGFLDAESGHTEDAMANFRNAVLIYESKKESPNILENLYNSHCGIAFVALMRKEANLAGDHLENGLEYWRRLKELDGTELGLGFYHKLRSRLSFVKGDYLSALDRAKKSRAEYQKDGDEVSATKMLNVIAFYNLLVGRIKEGQEQTREVSYRIEGEPKKFGSTSYYNAINWLILKRCSGHDSVKTYEEILDYSKKQDDKHLANLLEFAQTWDCGR